MYWSISCISKRYNTPHWRNTSPLNLRSWLLPYIVSHIEVLLTASMFIIHIKNWTDSPGEQKRGSQKGSSTYKTLPFVHRFGCESHIIFKLVHICETFGGRGSYTEPRKTSHKTVTPSQFQMHSFQRQDIYRECCWTSLYIYIYSRRLKILNLRKSEGFTHHVSIPLAFIALCWELCEHKRQNRSTFLSKWHVEGRFTPFLNNYRLLVCWW